MQAILMVLAAIATMVVAYLVIHRRMQRLTDRPPEGSWPAPGEREHKVEDESPREEKEFQGRQEGPDGLAKEPPHEADGGERRPEPEDESAQEREGGDLGAAQTSPQEQLAEGVQQAPEAEKEGRPVEQPELPEAQEGQEQLEEKGFGTEEAPQKVQAEFESFRQEPTDLSGETRHRKEKGPGKAGDGESPPPKQETKPVEPAKRGGRPRAPTPGHEEHPAPEGTRRRPKPDIVCWERRRQWTPAVEVPEDLLESPPGLTVLQNASALTRDEVKERCWPLEQAFGDVAVQFSEDEVVREIRVSLGEEGYLLFKLSGRDHNWGRLVKSPSSGCYLVIVPEDWGRDESLSGSAGYMPEAASLPGWQAHFFTLEAGNGGQIAFITPTGESRVIASKAPRFELIGSRLHDAGEEMGPLFGERSPTIRVVGRQAWEAVGTIVLGAEGGKSDGWRTSFAPGAGLSEQDVPAEIAERKAGWYFLRFYDLNDDLMESLDFRFVGGLKSIRLRQPPPLASEAGHANVSAELLHEPGCCVRLRDDLGGSVPIVREAQRTLITIPPGPGFDETRWYIGPEKGPAVEVVVLVERIWWTLGEKDRCPGQCEWQSTRLTLSCDDFTATSTKVIWIRLPRPRWRDTLLVGFEQSKSKPFRLKVGGCTLAVPLRGFEVADPTQQCFLRVWIERQGGLAEAAIALIPAKQASKRPEEPRLNIAAVPAGRLASVLTALLKVARGPSRVLIKEVRGQRFKGPRKRRRASPEFVKSALCVIALFSELARDGEFSSVACKGRWRARALLAREAFPEIISQLRSRYDLKTRRAYRAAAMAAGR